jgi:DNA-binding CsgD family transcriptional regulator
LAPHHLPLLHGRVLVEYETGHTKEGRDYLQRLLEADQRAEPYPLAGVFAAITLAQTATWSPDMAGSQVALAAIRDVLARAAVIPNAVMSARMARAFLCLRDPRAGDPEAELEFLARFENVVPSTWGVAMGRLLGLLARAAGQPRRAIARFDTALAFCRQSGYRPELAWTCLDYAGALLETGDRDDRAKAAALVLEAGQIAEALGMRPLAERIADFRERYRVRLDRKPAGLSTRELETLRLISTGKTNKEIAQALFISTNTVAIHVARVLAKTGASNRTEAAAYAARHHLFESTAPPVSSAAPSTPET